MSNQSNLSIITSAQLSALTHGQRIEAISILLNGSFSETTKRETLLALRDHDVDPVRIYFVSFVCDGENNAIIPCKYEDSEDSDTITVEIKVRDELTEEEEITEAINDARAIFRKQHEEIERAGWSYCIVTHEVKNWNPYRLEESKPLDIPSRQLSVAYNKGGK